MVYSGLNARRVYPDLEFIVFPDSGSSIVYFTRKKKGFFTSLTFIASIIEDFFKVYLALFFEAELNNLVYIEATSSVSRIRSASYQYFSSDSQVLIISD
jgi:hypothetical protein